MALSQEQDASVRVPVRVAARGLVRARAAAVAGRRRAAPQRAQLRRHRAGAQPAPQVLLHLPRQASRVHQAAQAHEPHDPHAGRRRAGPGGGRLHRLPHRARLLQRRRARPARAHARESSRRSGELAGPFVRGQHSPLLHQLLARHDHQVSHEPLNHSVLFRLCMDTVSRHWEFENKWFFYKVGTATQVLLKCHKSYNV